jgi:predicted ribosomally synthesized peptide with nif11-like leader
MSIESAKAFMERMQTDNDFAKKIMACKDWETARPLILGAGYEFTLDEFKTVQKDILDAALDDEALQNVSGGGGCSACGMGHLCCSKW